jgi:hypothetical protein
MKQKYKLIRRIKKTGWSHVTKGQIVIPKNQVKKHKF